MSEILLGDDYLVWIKTIGMTDYVAIDGQGTWTINRGQTKINTANKNRRGYNTSAYGNADITVDLDIMPILPDAGYTALETACKAVPRKPFMVELRKNGLDGVEADSIFTCLVNGSMPSTTGPQDDKLTTKAQFAIADAPTVDQLS